MSSLSAYLAELDQLYRTGHATEHSYRPALQRLLSATEELMRRVDVAMNAT